MKEHSKSQQEKPDATRRAFLRNGLALGGIGLLGQSELASAAVETTELPMVNGTRELATYPQKRELILMTARPVQLETPMHVFNEGAFTPNDAFFVRWHLSAVPTTVDGAAFRIRVHGRVKQTLDLSIKALQDDFEPVEIAAVCQCSGNSRGLFDPRVPGGQWANGAMGNAMWKGARLRDVLEKAGLESDAVQVRFNGADGGPMPGMPDFIKALDLDVATGEDVLLAYSMNGEPLPLLNGYPVRLVVPGWYATYWVKMLDDIEVIGSVDSNFWMNPAYRIPDNPCGCIEPGEQAKTVPINRMTVRSFITSLADGAKIKGGDTHTVKGIAFDGGYGIDRVLFSADGGRNWQETSLGKDHGRYSFREWSIAFKPAAGRNYELACLAISNNGESQRFSPRWNPAGYLRNVVEKYRVSAV
ncbi:MAG TPA: sulfide dehydrogenase [Chromatiales bacterium]|nr:sulfide dehydrogenase [Chromatiales bacterium]